jgi:hypothetical protein
MCYLILHEDDLCKDKLKERVEMGKENQNDIQKEVQKKMYTLVPNHLKD